MKRVRASITLLLSLLASSVGAVEVREAHYVMGTILDVRVDASTVAEGRTSIREAVGEARRLEGLLTRFDSTSDLSRLNRSAGTGRVRVDPDLFRILQQSTALSTRTGGAFDPTVRPLVRLWQEAASRGRWPADVAIAAARRLVGSTRLVLVPPDLVTLAAGSSIDLDGIAKGYAADRMRDVLRERGIGTALVNFGESTIAAIGPPPSRPAWEVWMRRAGGFAGPIRLRDRAISTSESLARAGRAGGHRFGDIVDPRTGASVTRDLRATVVTPTATEAEAWSKALLVAPAASLAALESRPDAAATIANRRAEHSNRRFAELVRADAAR